MAVFREWSASIACVCMCGGIPPFWEHTSGLPRSPQIPTSLAALLTFQSWQLTGAQRERPSNSWVWGMSSTSPITNTPSFGGPHSLTWAYLLAY